MSSPVVATVAWLALVVVVGLGAAVVVLLRRLDVLTRAHSDRKWEIATLRSELSELRRDLHPADEPPEQEPVEAGDGRGSRPWPSSPTAWRRDRGRPPVRPPRRRRPG